METKKGRRIKGGAKGRLLAGAIAAVFALQASANSLTAGPVVGSTDFGLFGISGLRGTGTGSITVSGVSGSVSSAYLIWHGVSNSATAQPANVTINGTTVTGTNIGLSSSNCWPFPTSQAYQANVTTLVSGNGTYALTNMRVPGSFDPNGASLLVFFNDGNASNNRDIAIFWGNDSNQTNSFDPAGWSATLPGINYGSGTATITLIVSDGQNFGETGSNTLTINSTPVVFPLFQGASLPVAPGSSVTNGGLWDHASANITSLLSPGPNTLNLTGNPESLSDCLSLVSTIFDLPAGTVTPPVPPTSAAPTGVPTASAIGLVGMSFALALLGMRRLVASRRLTKRDDRA